MCDYQGYEFGAGRYKDSYCIEGCLHDADSDYLSDAEIPCPICRPQDAIQWWAGDDSPEAIESATSLVNDIRANRGLAVAA